MIRYFLFVLKCRFDERYEWRYYKQIDNIRDQIFGDHAYPWEQFMCDVEHIAEVYNIPEGYVYADLKEIMPHS